MSRLIIKTGTLPNDKTGDSLFAAFNKVNANFEELYALTGGTTGRTTFPNGTVPAHSYGAAGDTAGMLAVDASYIYYCTANFDVATPAADIWKRTAHGTGTW